MADMAPALTEAATETQQRLKLAASSPRLTEEPPEPLLSVWRRPGLQLNGGGLGMEEPREESVCPLRAVGVSLRQQQELGARARRLCRRLQVIQAKQVERHVRQQVSGLVRVLGAAGLPGCHHGELERLAGSGSARLTAALGAFDSDATESSSGGDSDEEQPEPPTGGTEQPGLTQRADWRWAMERAAIICRWTWLQAQVSDLEFRIRQQTEIYKQIRCTKGSVLLGDCPQSEDVASRQSVVNAAAALNQKSNGVTCPLSSVKAPPVENPRDLSHPSHALHHVDKQCSRLTQSENVPCQNPSTTPLSESPGSQKPSHQVNGLLHCMRSTVSCNGSAEDLDAEEVLGKKRRLEVLAVSPALTDGSCVAARTRPLRAHKKRRLVRSGAVSSLSRKPQKPLSMKCSCEPPTTCILCGCKTHVKTIHPSTMTLNERIALMDPGYHPILSFPHDTSLNLHFEALLKEERPFHLTHKLKALKLSQLSRRPVDNMRRYSESGMADLAGKDYAHGRSDQEKLSQYRIENWQRNARLITDCVSDKVRSQLRKAPPTSTHSVGSLFRDDRQYKVVPSPGIHISTPFTPRSSSASHQHPSLMETPTTPSANLQNSAAAALKRKRLENSYDINNIVIPMSMAAASRVEKLQYKEILTPSWRVLDLVEREPLYGMDPQLEDLTDEAYLNRHSAYEELERSRWDFWSTAATQRRGSRSSNKSDGRWTPQPSSNSQGSLQPASPDIGFHSLNDVPFTLSSAAPDSPEPYSTVQCLSVRSTTRGLSWSEDTRSSTPEIPDEEEQIVLPWEPRTFPLSDRDHQTLQNRPVTPSRGRHKQHPDVAWNPANKSSSRTNSIDFALSTENLAPSSKDHPLPNSISVVRFRAHSGEKIASLECFPDRPVKR
ncbi:KAT8 regulatory NSL complex subunit 1 [Xenopus laevis]|uniref:KAT8 regulatory NSL complex subunit 1 n=2 Tax=Xenopus laevis TaxID=8355 RepID=A0A8J1KZG3_XENLA|nr:KAT8 regulatory NSL complex subunit 1 [Xenopus laevis]